MHTEREGGPSRHVLEHISRHELDKTHDWVVIYHERMATRTGNGRVRTSGPLKDKRVVRGESWNVSNTMPVSVRQHPPLNSRRTYGEKHHPMLYLRAFQPAIEAFDPRPRSRCTGQMPGRSYAYVPKPKSSLLFMKARSFSRKMKSDDDERTQTFAPYL